MKYVKKGDFIELDYTGKLKDGKVFDTSVKEVGEKESIHKHNYSSLKICVGENQVIKGLDKRLGKTEVEKDYTFEIPVEEAYGKKDPKLIRIVSRNIFTKQKLNPYPGMQITAEGSIGIVRTVSGGRIFVDFNHPLAGKDLIFDVRIKKIITDTKEKVQSLITNLVMLDSSKYNLSFKQGKLKINTKINIPDVMLNVVREKIQKLVPEIKSMEFSKAKKEDIT